MQQYYNEQDDSGQYQQYIKNVNSINRMDRVVPILYNIQNESGIPAAVRYLTK